MTNMTHIQGPVAFAEAFTVSRETLVKLEVYASLLRQWQKTINLVAPSTLDDLWHRHMADSAQLVALAEREKSGQPPFPSRARATSKGASGKGGCPGFSDFSRWIDLGSGAGFPGLVVAILLAERRPELRVTLVESDQRKCAFLREVARQTGTAVEILSTRIEKCATDSFVPAPDFVSARALAPLDKLLHLSLPLFASSTIGLFPKGRDAAQEVATARQIWRFDATFEPSLTDAAGRIVIVRNVGANAEE